MSEGGGFTVKKYKDAIVEPANWLASAIRPRKRLDVVPLRATIFRYQMVQLLKSAEKAEVTVSWIIRDMLRRELEGVRP